MYKYRIYNNILPYNINIWQSELSASVCVPVCLVCCARLVRGHVSTCPGCGWPLCSPACRDQPGQHARECSLFRAQGTRFDLEDVRAARPSYGAIMVLRLLWLRRHAPATWAQLDMLMDHRGPDTRSGVQGCRVQLQSI